MPARSKKPSKKKPSRRKKAAAKKKSAGKKKAAAKKKSSGKKAAKKKKKPVATKKATKKKRKAAGKKPARKKTAAKKKPARRKAARKGKDEALARHDPEFLLGLYRDMIRTRALDERIEALYKQGKLVAGCFSCRGQEGCESYSESRSGCHRSTGLRAARVSSRRL